MHSFHAPVNWLKTTQESWPDSTQLAILLKIKTSGCPSRVAFRVTQRFQVQVPAIINKYNACTLLNRRFWPYSLNSACKKLMNQFSVNKTFLEDHSRFAWFEKLYENVGRAHVPRLSVWNAAESLVFSLCSQDSENSAVCCWWHQSCGLILSELILGLSDFLKCHK